MFKKLQLFCLALLSTSVVNSQVAPLPQNTCGNTIPSQQWEDWISVQAANYKQNKAQARTQQVNYTIPVIVHIIHFGEPVGTFPNIDSNQVKSQLKVMNDDFGGVGLNSTAIPPEFAGVAAGNTGIKFCRARVNPTNGILAEYGIDRVDASIFPGWQNPNTPTLNVINFIETVVKPNTIWDPTKYMNIWVSDKPPTETVHAYATYPSSTTLNGLYGGYSVGTFSTDGIWCWTTEFGTIGAPVPHDKGRTMTHETGHWLGLRHIWGDGSCLSDYASDTPMAQQANFGCPAVPSYINRCGVSTSPVGEMTMNFMDRTNDACMSMFTVEQSVRMLTAMSQSPHRNQLGMLDLCPTFTATSTNAVPGFSLHGSVCVNQPFTPMNTSSGFPAPSYIWSSSPPAVFYPDPTVANPAITFNSAGNYTLTLVATNTVSNASYSMVVTPATNCPPAPLCIDSLSIIRKTDTIASYRVPNSTIVAGCLNGFAGYMTGNNCYKDKEYAQFYPPSSYSATPYPQVNSVIILFDKDGTRQGGGSAAALASKVTCKIYGGTIQNGPVSALATKQDSLGYIVATPPTNVVQYIGVPNQTFVVAQVIPYKFNFNPPVVINSPNTGFFAGVEVPVLFPGDSIRIMSNTKYNSVNDSSAWALTFGNTWKPLKSYRSTKIQLAIMPIITCSPLVGIKEEKLTAFTSNISVVPNPNNGVFNLVFTLPKEEELYVKIYNAVGQVVSDNHLTGVTNNLITVDMTDKPDGIYFTEISNGSERVVKKIIVSR